MVAAGHALDANTLALWRFNESPALIDTRGTTFTDSTGQAWTMAEGPLGITDGPVDGYFARRFTADETVAGMRLGLRRSTPSTLALRTFLIGSWTWEAKVLVGSLPTGGAAWRIFAHGGLSSSETSANNDLIQINLLDNGSGGLWFQIFWESGSGTNTNLLQASGGAVPVDQWCHLGVTKDTAAKEVRCYVNGALVATLPYVNEPFDGSSGCLCWGANEASTTLGVGFDGAVSYASMSAAVKDATWMAANAARLTTHHELITDGSLLLFWDFSQTPAATDERGKYHLVSTGMSAGDITTMVSPLINDGGTARWFSKCAMRTWWSEEIRNAMLADFTWEAWVLIGAPPAVTNGLFAFGNPGATELEAGNHVSAQVYPDGSLRLITEYGAGLDQIYTTAPGIVEFGVRQHIGIVKRMHGATYGWEVYMGGQLVEASPTTLTNYTGGTDVETCGFQLGMTQHTPTAADPYHIGSMDDVRLSDIARSPEELVESFDRGTEPEIIVRPLMYRMRAWDVSLNRYVYWMAEEEIDDLGEEYLGAGPLVDVVVMYVIGRR